MATTTNFGWETPDDTDLVKDGAAAIRTLGGAIDTSLVDLKGGTTGQVLSKASNTDMDFTWVAQDDSNAIQNTIVDAKGDIITATAADTPARLAVGADGYTLVADSSTSTGLAYSPTFFAGKNKIINGDMRIWQRGTSISLTNGVSAYTADRFEAYSNFSAGSASVSRQSFTAGTAPVAGYEAPFFLRITNGSTATYVDISQKIEDVRTFAGQTVTFSFWAKASGSIVMQPALNQNFGSGGSSAVVNNGSNITLTTSWTRYTATIAIPSISGKTIGTNSFLYSTLAYVSGTLNSATIDIWGWQVEAGSTATQFQTATGTIQGELSAAQRYYFKSGGRNLWSGNTTNAATYYVTITYPVTMRTNPTLAFTSGGSTNFASGAPTTSDNGSPNEAWVGNPANATGNGGFYQFEFTASAEL